MSCCFIPDGKVTLNAEWNWQSSSVKVLSSTVSGLCVSRHFTLHSHWEMQLFGSRMGKRSINVEHECVWMLPGSLPCYITSHLVYWVWPWPHSRAAGRMEQGRRCPLWVESIAVLRRKWSGDLPFTQPLCDSFSPPGSGAEWCWIHSTAELSSL